MPIAVKTEGIILKRKNFGEADRILTIFSQKLGKVNVLARGVRKITSRRAGNVELLNRVSVFLHPGKNFYILTEASSINTYQRLKEDLTLSTYAYHLIELVDRFVLENQDNRQIYYDFVNVLEKLSTNPRQIFIRAFEVKILSASGFWSLGEVEVSDSVREILGKLRDLNWDKIEQLEVNQDQALELEQVLRYYIERVIEGQLKSRQFLKKL